MSLKKLRILNVSNSENLTKTGDFYGLENLEELSFRSCSSLKELHSSIGCLHKLAILDLFCCRKLKTIPWEMIAMLPSLQNLYLATTTGLEAGEVTHPFLSSLEEPLSFLQLHNLNEIELLHAIDPDLPLNITSIKASHCNRLASLPSNISELKSLAVLDFRDNPKLGSKDPQFLMKVTGLTNLNQLTMVECGVSQLPNDIGNLVSLKKLDLSGNSFLTA
ncbi:hypothetical protein L1987_78119 [Smallanthus sonchifolius]|uniref:Uncharacterized protein n=1 Tax=Smallanthus sonchifolius TaxID=185202 RepID=A0ACB8ZCA4_9ASTR|nr:hypothetical protein L1987_78119 [Smallanthus sonchifolius]